MEEQNRLCDAETDCYDVTDVHIFNELPSIAALNVLNFLDQKTLRNLRAVCRVTKCLTDSTLSVMKRLRVYIQDKFRMEEIIRSEVNWSNIQIPSGLCNAKLIPFLHRYRSSITRIKIVNNKESICPKSLNPIDLINILVELNGGFLESLCIRADLAPKRAPGARSHLEGTEEFDVNILKTLLEDSKEILRRNLRRLRRLEFRWMSSNSVILDLLLNCFYDVCRNMVYKRLPLLLPREQSRRDDKSPLLTSYLDRIVGSPRKYELITIDFGSVGFGSDWDHRGHYGHRLYPLTSDRFIKLLRFLEKENLRVRLLNVPRLTLPGKENLREVEKEMLNRYVRSIHWTGIIGEGLLMKEMYIPLNCQVKISLQLLHEHTLEYSLMQRPIPTALNITAVCLFMTLSRTDSSMHSMMEYILYPTVVSLMIYKVDYIDTPLTMILSKMFPNVRKLYLNGCPRLDCYSEESPLNGLNQLEKLTLKDCGLTKNHSKPGFPLTHPLFIKFKKLHRLRISSWSATKHNYI